MQKSVRILRFLNFKKFAKQKEKPAQPPGFLIFLSGWSMLALIEQKTNNYSLNLCTMSKCIKQNGCDFTSG